MRLIKTAGDDSTIADDTQSLSQLDNMKRDQIIQDTSLDESITSFFGAVFARHEGEGIKLLGVLDDTPAQNSGLQKGDVILEVETVSFRDQGPQPGL